MAEQTISVKVLLCEERHADGTLWVAQCLTHDIAAQGDSRSVAERAIFQALQEQVDRDRKQGVTPPLRDFAKAPPAAWDVFETAVRETAVAAPSAGAIRAEEVRICRR